MSAKRNYIVGAGLAGLLCACAFEGDIFDAGGPNQMHRALLRFRGDSVSRLTGIPFKRVTVHKEIWQDGKTYHKCSNQQANLYSLKVTGAAIGRSIRDLSTVERYVAPDDLYQQLIERHKGRISWESPINADFIHACKEVNANIINTAPMPSMLSLIRGWNESIPDFGFEKSPIKVARLEFTPGKVDAYQTIYYPGMETCVYRASITGHTLIIESIKDVTPTDIAVVCEHFGLSPHFEIPRAEFVEQRYGKIIDLPKEEREAILYELTRDYGIFSIGRFATWRNILLDDVAEDIKRVSSLIRSSEYGRRLVYHGMSIK